MSLRDFIQHNFWLKLFSLLLATLIWFAINFGIKSGLRPVQNPIINQTTRQIIRVPVRVLTQPGDQRVFKVDPRDVDVTLTGETAVIREVAPRSGASHSRWPSSALFRPMKLAI